MSLRKDVIYMSKIDWEPKVPSGSVILEQAKNQISHGRSTGNVTLDTKAIDLMTQEDRKKLVRKNIFINHDKNNKTTK